MSVGTSLKPKTPKTLFVRDAVRSTLYARVTHCLEQIGQTEMWLAGQLGVHPSRLTKLRDRMSGGDFVANLAIVLGVSTDYLLGVQDGRKSA